MGLSNKLSYEAGSFSCCHLNPHGVFNLRFEALFPHAGALGCQVCFTPCRSSRFIYVRMWGHRVCQPPPCGVCYCILVCPAPQFTTSLGPPAPLCHKSSPPLLPVLPLLPVWMNVSSSPWLWDLHTV